MGLRNMERERKSKSKQEELAHSPVEAEPESEAHSLLRLQRGAGNQAIQKLLGGSGRVARIVQPGEASEQEARASGDAEVLNQAPAAVRIHHDREAATSARRINARAYTIGRDIVFGEGELDPRAPGGRKLLAHEMAHAAQPAEGGGEALLYRETAREVVAAYETDYVVVTSLDEEGLAGRLLGIIRGGRYEFAREVLMEVGWSDRDDVIGYLMPSLTILDLIRIGRSDPGKALLQLMKEELGSGWTTSEEADAGQLIEAILAPGVERNIWNNTRITAIRDEGGTDLESLARMFEDDRIIDDGSVSGRLQSILGATEHLVIPGLQTGISFQDTGFRGEPTPNGSGFRDPHPSSANQVGHFLTAVGLEFSPEVVSRPIPFFGSIRQMVRAPAAMNDAEVALRLTIGHEKAPDPNGSLEVLLNVAGEWAFESLSEGPEGETDEQRDERIDRAVGDEIDRQVRAIIAAFRAQFNACTDADVAAWNEALANFRSDESSLERPGNALDRIAVDPSMKGNSRQDLRLSLVGWRLGEKIGAGEFESGAAVAAWIRANLGAQ